MLQTFGFTVIEVIRFLAVGTCSSRPSWTDELALVSDSIIELLYYSI